MSEQELDEAADGLEYAAAQMRLEAKRFSDHYAMRLNRQKLARRYSALAKKLRSAS